VSLELCSLCTTLLRYRPSPSCSSSQAQQIQTAQDAFASSLVQRRLKAVYFHLSSSNRARSNAALALLTAVSNRGGSVLRELLSHFDFTLAVLPKLARPPRAAVAAAAADNGTDGSPTKTAAAAAGEQPGHWATWNSPQMSKRPSRAMFIGWGKCFCCCSTCADCLFANRDSCRAMTDRCVFLTLALRRVVLCRAVLQWLSCCSARTPCYCLCCCAHGL
jgi:hypothetical protein